ncbi:MAG: hypothetical protein IPJ45_14150 [Ignavibacteria bacterium]|nr:hypothetical protein [Ignavibacteria bacterium]
MIKITDQKNLFKQYQYENTQDNFIFIFIGFLFLIYQNIMAFKDGIVGFTKKIVMISAASVMSSNRMIL